VKKYCFPILHLYEIYKPGLIGVFSQLQVHINSFISQVKKKAHFCFFQELICKKWVKSGSGPYGVIDLQPQ